MNNKNNSKEELKDAPFLAAHSRETGFQAPENYFESFDAQLKERLATESGSEQKGQPRAAVRWLQPRFMAVAAMLALLLTCFALWKSESAQSASINANIAQSSASFALQGVSLEEAEAYVLEHIEEFDDELLMASMNEEGSTINDLSEEELEQYLDGEGLENLSEEELEQLL